MAVISQESWRLERIDKGGNTDKPGGGDFCWLQELLRSKWTMCPRESWWGVSYGILLQNYEGLWELCWEVLRGAFQWFSEISLREKAAAGTFWGALVNF